MDFTTLVAGPAQAGPLSPVSTPGIGFTAGAGAAPAVDAAAGDGFASLVALALDQMDGVASAAGEAACPSCRAPRIDDGTDDVPDAETGDDRPLDAPVDAATLSLLMVLATPVAAAPPSQPEVVAPGGSDPAVDVDVDVAAGSTAAPAAAEDPGAVSPMPAGPTTPASRGVPAPAAPAAAPAAVGPTLEAPAAPAGDVAAALPQPAAAPEPAAPAVPPAAPRAGQRQATHPLRQALAAMAAAVASDTTPGPAGQPAVTTATPRTAGSIASASASASAPAPEAATVTVAGRGEGRAAAASRVEAAVVAPAAAVGAASDAAPTGEGSGDGARGGIAGTASTPVRGAEAPVDAAVFPVSTTGTATTAALPSPAGTGTGFGAAGDTMLRAIDLPAAVRFEQALSSVDPDVRNLRAMVRTVRLVTTGGGAHEARLNLEPEHLGPVALTVRVEQGSVSAHFRAETPAAQRWIEAHQQELRAGLREQGLEVKDVVVTTDPDGRRDRRQDAEPARAPRPRRAPDADAPRFEVLV